MHPAFCGPVLSCRSVFEPPDVRLYLMVEQEGPKGGGYNIREESLTGRGHGYMAPSPVSGLSHIIYAAGLFSPLQEWCPVELYERWAYEHAPRLVELRRNNPLEEPKETHRRAALERAFEELGPPREWCLLAELMEPRDIVITLGGVT